MKIENNYLRYYCYYFTSKHKQVRQQDAYTTNAGGAVKLGQCATVVVLHL